MLHASVGPRDCVRLDSGLEPPLRVLLAPDIEPALPTESSGTRIPCMQLAAPEDVRPETRRGTAAGGKPRRRRQRGDPLVPDGAPPLPPASPPHERPANRPYPRASMSCPNLRSAHRRSRPKPSPKLATCIARSWCEPRHNAASVGWQEAQTSLPAKVGGDPAATVPLSPPHASKEAVRQMSQPARGGTIQPDATGQPTACRRFANDPISIVNMTYCKVYFTVTPVGETP